MSVIDIDKFFVDNFSLKLNSLPVFEILSKMNQRAEPADTPGSIVKGTTIVALKYNEGKGVIVAADKRASTFQGYDDDAIKISELDGFSLLAFAGTVGYAQQLEEEFRRAVADRERLYGIALTLNGKAKVLKRVLAYNLRGLSYGIILGYVAVPIFAGYSQYHDAASIFYYDAAAASLKSDKYKAIGSGVDHATTALDILWKHDLDEESAQAVAITALFHAGNRNYYTSSSPLSPPIIKSASENGIKTLAEGKSLETSWRAYLEFLRRQGEDENITNVLLREESIRKIFKAADPATEEKDEEGEK